MEGMAHLTLMVKDKDGSILSLQRSLFAKVLSFVIFLSAGPVLSAIVFVLCNS